MIITPVKVWRRQKDTTDLIGKKGKILNWTVIRVPAKEFSNEAPYPVVIVKMDGGKKLIGQLVDFDEKHLKKGQEVIAVLRKIFPKDKESIIPYHIKFKPNE